MKKFFKISAYILGGIAGVLILVLAWLDIAGLSTFRSTITDSVYDSSGYVLEIGEDSDLDIFGGIGISLKNIALYNSRDKKNDPFIRLDSAEVEVSFLSLLIGNVVVDGPVISGLTISQITNNEGSDNFTPENTPTTQPSTEEPPVENDPPPSNLGLSFLEINNLSLADFSYKSSVAGEDKIDFRLDSLEIPQFVISETTDLSINFFIKISEDIFALEMENGFFSSFNLNDNGDLVFDSASFEGKIRKAPGLQDKLPLDLTLNITGMINPLRMTAEDFQLLLNFGDKILTAEIKTDGQATDDQPLIADANLSIPSVNEIMEFLGLDVLPADTHLTLSSSSQLLSSTAEVTEFSISSKFLNIKSEEPVKIEKVFEMPYISGGIISLDLSQTLELDKALNLNLLNRELPLSGKVSFKSDNGDLQQFDFDFASNKNLTLTGRNALNLKDPGKKLDGELKLNSPNLNRILSAVKGLETYADFPLDVDLTYVAENNFDRFLLKDSKITAGDLLNITADVDAASIKNKDISLKLSIISKKLRALLEKSLKGIRTGNKFPDNINLDLSAELKTEENITSNLNIIWGDTNLTLAARRQNPANDKFALNLDMKGFKAESLEIALPSSGGQQKFISKNLSSSGLRTGKEIFLNFAASGFLDRDYKNLREGVISLSLNDLVNLNVNSNISNLDEEPSGNVGLDLKIRDLAEVSRLTVYEYPNMNFPGRLTVAAELEKDELSINKFDLDLKYLLLDLKPVKVSNLKDKPAVKNLRLNYAIVRVKELLDKLNIQLLKKNSDIRGTLTASYDGNKNDFAVKNAINIFNQLKMQTTADGRIFNSGGLAVDVGLTAEADNLSILLNYLEGRNIEYPIPFEFSSSAKVNTSSEKIDFKISELKLADLLLEADGNMAKFNQPTYSLNTELEFRNINLLLESLVDGLRFPAEMGKSGRLDITAKGEAAKSNSIDLNITHGTAKGLLKADVGLDSGISFKGNMDFADWKVDDYIPLESENTASTSVKNNSAQPAKIENSENCTDPSEFLNKPIADLLKPFDQYLDKSRVQFNMALKNIEYQSLKVEKILADVQYLNRQLEVRNTEVDFGKFGRISPAASMKLKSPFNTEITLDIASLKPEMINSFAGDLKLLGNVELRSSIISMGETPKQMTENAKVNISGNVGNISLEMPDLNVFLNTGISFIKEDDNLEFSVSPIKVAMNGSVEGEVNSDGIYFSQKVSELLGRNMAISPIELRNTHIQIDIPESQKEADGDNADTPVDNVNESENSSEADSAVTRRSSRNVSGNSASNCKRSEISWGGLAIRELVAAVNIGDDKAEVLLNEGLLKEIGLNQVNKGLSVGLFEISQFLTKYNTQNLEAKASVERVSVRDTFFRSGSFGISKIEIEKPGATLDMIQEESQESPEKQISIDSGFESIVLEEFSGSMKKSGLEAILPKLGIYNMDSKFELSSTETSFVSTASNQSIELTNLSFEKTGEDSQVNLEDFNLMNLSVKSEGDIQADSGIRKIGMRANGKFGQETSLNIDDFLIEGISSKIMMKDLDSGVELREISLRSLKTVLGETADIRLDQFDLKEFKASLVSGDLKMSLQKLGLSLGSAEVTDEIVNLRDFTFLVNDIDARPNADSKATLKRIELDFSRFNLTDYKNMDLMTILAENSLFEIEAVDFKGKLGEDDWFGNMKLFSLKVPEIAQTNSLYPATFKFDFDVGQKDSDRRITGNLDMSAKIRSDFKNGIIAVKELAIDLYFNKFAYVEDVLTKFTGEITLNRLEKFLDISSFGIRGPFTTADLNASLKNYDTAPILNFDLKAGHTDMNPILVYFGLPAPEDRDSPLSIIASGEFNQETENLLLTVDELKFDRTTAALKVDGKANLENTSLDALLDLKLNGLRPTVDLFAPELFQKADKKYVNTFSLESNISFKDDILEISELDALLDETATLKIDFSTNTDFKEFVFDIDLAELNIDNYFPPPPRNLEEEEKEEEEEEEKDDKPFEYSKEPLIPLDVVKEYNVDGKLLLHNITARTVKIVNGQAIVDLKDGELSRGDVMLKTDEGMLDLRLVSSFNDPNHDIKLYAHDFQMGQVINPFSKRDILFGFLNSEIDLTLEGNSVYDFAHSVTGLTNIVISDGELKKINMDYYVCLGINYLTLSSIRDTSKEDSNIERLLLYATADRGDIDIKSLDGDIESTNAFIATKLNLPEKSFDGDIYVSLIPNEDLNECNIGEAYGDFVLHLECDAKLGDPYIDYCELDPAQLTELSKVSYSSKFNEWVKHWGEQIKGEK